MYFKIWSHFIFLGLVVPMGNEILQLPYRIPEGACKGNVCQCRAMDTTWAQWLQRINLLQSSSTHLATATVAFISYNRRTTCLSTMSTLCGWKNSTAAMSTHHWQRPDLGRSVHARRTEQSPRPRLYCNRGLWSAWIWEMGSVWWGRRSITVVRRLHQCIHKNEVGSKRMAESQHDGRGEASIHWSLSRTRWNRVRPRRTRQGPKLSVETNSCKQQY